MAGWDTGSVDTSHILARLTLLEQGNFGDCKPIGERVSELRGFFGSGYRVYFGENGNDLVVLLCGGGKSSQDANIQHAKIGRGI